MSILLPVCRHARLWALS